MKRFGTYLSSILCALFVGACGHDIQTPVNPEQLRNAFASGPAAALKDAKNYCVADAHGAFAATGVVIDDKGHADNHDYVQGGACLPRAIAQAWAASRARESFHWDKSDLDDVHDGSAPGEAYQFLSDQSAGPSFFRVHWTMQWDHTVVDGTANNPRRILIQFQKIKGTSHIRYWQGAVTLLAVSPDFTSVAMRDEVDADQTGVDDTVLAVQNYIGKLGQ